MKKLSLLIILFFAARALGLNAAEIISFSESGISNPFSKIRIEAGYSAGQFIGIKQSYAELGLFLPIFSENTLTSFIDCRGYRLNNAKWGLSSGIGIRKHIDDDQMIGANIYYDYLEGNFHKSFQRAGFGLEWLGECLDFRINTYFPVGHQIHSSKIASYTDYIGRYKAACRTKQFSIGSGVDAEVGHLFSCWNTFNVYGAAGPYYYSARQKNNYFGGQARIEVTYQSLVSIQIRTSYDKINHSRTQGQIQISIPFDILSSGLTCFNEDRSLQPVTRTGVIFTDDCCDYKWNW